jgi:hypothetical protein
MSLRAWAIISVFVLASSVNAKPPSTNSPLGVDGKATPALTQDYYQSEPVPKFQSAQPARSALPPKYTPPTAIGDLVAWLVSLAQQVR